MLKKNITQKLEIMHRELKNCHMDFDKMIEEIKLQRNRCPECQQKNIQYPENIPKLNIYSWGDGTNWFTSYGLLRWTATCLECKADIPIYISCNYDIKKEFEINIVDSFLDENGDYGHTKRKLF